jgi:hypothetical protein
MNESFRPDPDREIGAALATHFKGPDPDGFTSRLGAALGRLPKRDSQWDILAEWARPRVMAAALAAGFLLGMAMWQRWQRRAVEVPSGSPVSMAMLENARPGAVLPIINVVLEDR